MITKDMMTLWTHEEFAEAERLIGALDAIHPDAGYGSLDSEDLDRNAAILLDVVRQKRYCRDCPGVDECRADRGWKNPVRYLPRTTVARKIWLETDAKGRGVIRVGWGPCRERRAL